MARKRPQLVISFDIPPEIQRGFPQFLDKVQKHIVRQSIRSAILPARNSLKAKYMLLLSKSRQSSGATLRSLTTKYGATKSNPFRFYGIIGVDRKVLEYFDPTQRSPVYRNAMMRQVNFGVKARMVDGVQTYTRRQPRREVRSGLRRRFGVHGANALNNRKRKPSRYLHLTEYGFNGPGRRHFKGHHFVERSKQDSQDECRAIFAAKVREHFRRAFR